MKELQPVSQIISLSFTLNFLRIEVIDSGYEEDRMPSDTYVGPKKSVGCCSETQLKSLIAVTNRIKRSIKYNSTTAVLVIKPASDESVNKLYASKAT